MGYPPLWTTHPRSPLVYTQVIVPFEALLLTAHCRSIIVINTVFIGSGRENDEMENGKDFV